MFHAVGRTPEAPTLDDALQDGEPDLEIDLDLATLRRGRDDLSTSAEGPLGAVSVGTPHFSMNEFHRLHELLAGRAVSSDVDVYVSTGREVLAAAAAAGIVSGLRRAGVEIVTDTCTYVTPIMRGHRGVVMTNSAKWAYYGPGNLGVEVVFGSLEDCVESAVSGTVVRDETIWHD